MHNQPCSQQQNLNLGRHNLDAHTTLVHGGTRANDDDLVQLEGVICVQMRTFMCCPLRDNGGLVEWVPNTTTFFAALRGTYAHCGVSSDKWHPSHVREKWKSVYDQCYHPQSNHGPGPLRKWMTGMYKNLPPVMHEWWLKRCASRSTLLRNSCTHYLFSLWEIETVAPIIDVLV